MRSKKFEPAGGRRRRPVIGYAARMDLTSETRVLITGANGGIGRAIAKTLRRSGAQLILTGRRADALAPIAAEVQARVVVADLARRADVDRCVDEAGPIDVLVANAGLPGTGTALEFTPEQIEKALDVNLLAPILQARRFAEGMIERKRGHIVFISSISGKVATGQSSIYSATKFGLRGFALGLREDLRAHGVGVTTIYPGFIRDAGMFAEAGVKLPAGAGTRSPEDVARAVERAIRKNPAELNVSAFDQSLGAFLFAFSPSLVTWLARAFGGEKIAKQLSAGQTHKR
jgi:short-subunit dehydrogenase